MFRVANVVYCVDSCAQRLRVREARPDEIAHRGDVPSLHMPIAAVRALFEGPGLARAQRVAALTSTCRSIIFGAPGERHYNMGSLLHQIGRAIPAPRDTGCTTCTSVDGACGLDCQRRLVAETLADAPFHVLVAASRHVEPAAQLHAAALARITRKAKAKRGKPGGKPARPRAKQAKARAA